MSNPEGQQEEVASVKGLFVPADGEHTTQESESSSQIPREDAGKEELDLGSPNDSDSEQEKSLGGWNSHDDPGNPKNWAFGKKVFHTAIPALYGFVM